MSKASSSRLNQIKLADSDFSDNPIIDWLSTNKQNILWGVLALFIVIILSNRLLANRTQNAEIDYFQANVDFTRFEEKSGQPQNWTASQDELAQLSTILNRRPELQAKYDGLIAQTLIIEQNPTEAQPFAERTFQRTDKDALNFYQDYARTSLLITSGDFSQATAQAQQLKEKMTQDTVGQRDTLYVFNLIRLAMLYQKMGQGQNELQAWEDLQQYNANPAALVTAYQLFREGEASILQYMETRRQELNGKK